MGKDLNDIRKEIDALDDELIRLLGKRLELVDLVAEYKKKNDLPVMDAGRVDEVIRSRSELAEKEGIPGNVAAKVFRDLIDYFMRREEEKMREEQGPEGHTG